MADSLKTAVLHSVDDGFFNLVLSNDVPVWVALLVCGLKRA